MSLNSEQDEIEGIVNRMMNALSASTSQTGIEGFLLRKKIGDMRANYFEYLKFGTFSVNLLACFTAAKNSHAKLPGLFFVHQTLFAETPAGEISTIIVQVAITFCLATECRIIGLIEFVSRDDVESMMNTMKAVFDAARFLAADMLDSSAYQKLTTLAGALTNHLATVSRPLPRMINFVLPEALPALALSQLVYYDATRSDEICLENKIVHPAFVTREIRGLSK